MAKSLHTLIRLHQHRVDEKRRELGGMLAVVSDLERQVDALESKIIKEQYIAKSSPDLAAPFIPIISTGVAGSAISIFLP